MAAKRYSHNPALRRQHRRHWITGRRADWLAQVMADPRLTPDAKVVAYAIVTNTDEQMMREGFTIEEILERMEVADLNCAGEA
jgi:hypothetical protein